ncbi:MAG TPA: hypothetical protein VFT62_10275 [Mycobacteriales bacterium]|nr:hypothetical protein [Mycobacteriales bacterium]
MTPVTDEGALRTALTDLAAADQPDQPRDRLNAVRRRHLRRRAFQAGATAVVAAAAVVAGLLGTSAVGGRATEPLHRSAPGWALQWPDHRDGSVPQRVLDGAVTAWRAGGGDSHGVTPLPKPLAVVWYAGQTVASGRAVVAVFEADLGTSRRLVTATALASDVLNRHRPGTLSAPRPWTVHDAPAPDPQAPPALVGAYVRDQQPFDNWALVLTRPGNPQLTWSASGAAGGTVPMHDGLAVFEVGQVRGPVSVALQDQRSAHGTGPAAPVRVGLRGNALSQAPQLAPVADLVLGGNRLVAGMGGQGRGAAADFGLRRSRARLVLIGRCYGPGEVHLVLDDGPFRANLPCDDRQHTVSTGRLRPQPRGHLLFVDAGPLTAWSVTVARP